MKSGKKLLRWILLIYLASLHVLVAWLFLQTDALPSLRHEWLGTAPTSNPHIQRMLRYHLSIEPQIPEGATVFLGDSITQGLATSAVAPRSVNYGIGTATTSDLIQHLPQYRSLNRASAAFLMIGINDFGDLNRVTEMPARLQKISQLIPEKLPLIWSGLAHAHNQIINDDWVQATNLTIEQLCAARPNCVYVNTSALLAPQPSRYFSDAVHLNDLGYASWIRALREAHAQAIGGQ